MTCNEILTGSLNTDPIRLNQNPSRVHFSWSIVKSCHGKLDDKRGPLTQWVPPPYSLIYIEKGETLSRHLPCRSESDRGSRDILFGSQGTVHVIGTITKRLCPGRGRVGSVRRGAQGVTGYDEVLRLEKRQEGRRRRYTEEVNSWPI